MSQIRDQYLNFCFLILLTVITGLHFHLTNTVVSSVLFGCSDMLNVFIRVQRCFATLSVEIYLPSLVLLLVHTTGYLLLQNPTPDQS